MFTYNLIFHAEKFSCLSTYFYVATSSMHAYTPTLIYHAYLPTYYLFSAWNPNFFSDANQPQLTSINSSHFAATITCWSWKCAGKLLNSERPQILAKHDAFQCEEEWCGEDLAGKSRTMGKISRNRDRDDGVQFWKTSIPTPRVQSHRTGSSQVVLRWSAYDPGLGLQARVRSRSAAMGELFEPEKDDFQADQWDFGPDWEWIQNYEPWNRYVWCEDFQYCNQKEDSIADWEESEAEFRENGEHF